MENFVSLIKEKRAEAEEKKAVGLKNFNLDAFSQIERYLSFLDKASLLSSLDGGEVSENGDEKNKSLDKNSSTKRAK